MSDQLGTCDFSSNLHRYNAETHVQCRNWQAAEAQGGGSQPPNKSFNSRLKSACLDLAKKLFGDPKGIVGHKIYNELKSRMDFNISAAASPETAAQPSKGITQPITYPGTLSRCCNAPIVEHDDMCCTKCGHPTSPAEAAQPMSERDECYAAYKRINESRGSFVAAFTPPDFAEGWQAARAGMGEQVETLKRGVDIGFQTAQLNQQEQQLRWWFDEREAKVIDELAAKKDLSRQAVLRQALRTYQLVAEEVFDLVERNPKSKLAEATSLHPETPSKKIGELVRVIRGIGDVEEEDRQGQIDMAVKYAEALRPETGVKESRLSGEASGGQASEPQLPSEEKK